MRVLLVDDQPDYRKAMAVTLRYLGCSVIEYGGIAEALSGESPDVVPDLIVTDIDLVVGKNGVKFAAAARCQWPDLPILFVGSLERAAALVAMGRSAMLRKPFKLTELTKAMGLLLSEVPDPAAARAA